MRKSSYRWITKPKLALSVRWNGWLVCGMSAARCCCCCCDYRFLLNQVPHAGAAFSRFLSHVLGGGGGMSVGLHQHQQQALLGRQERPALWPADLWLSSFFNAVQECFKKPTEPYITRNADDKLILGTISIIMNNPRCWQPHKNRPLMNELFTHLSSAPRRQTPKRHFIMRLQNRKLELVHVF